MNSKRYSLARSLEWLFTGLEILIGVYMTFVLVALIRGALGLKQTNGGQFVFGNVGLKLDPAVYHLVSPTTRALSVSLDNLFGSVGFQFPAVLPLYRTLLAPLCGIIICRTLVMVVLCELFRRLFRSVVRREVFSHRNMRSVQLSGALVLVLAFTSPLFEHVYASRMISFFNQNVATQGAISIDWRLPPSTGMSAGTFEFPHDFMARIDDDTIYLGQRKHLFRLDARGLLLGLVLLGLGGALRQGLVLREESELTV
jgi:hypothetical protein